MKQPPDSLDLVPVETVRMQMVLPTTGMPIPERSVYIYMDQLGIQAQLKKLNGKGMPRRHVSKDDAERLLELFKAKHWRKFQTAKPGENK